jgi:hypothetical protein
MNNITNYNEIINESKLQSNFESELGAQLR